MTESVFRFHGKLDGPAIVESPLTTVVLPPGASLAVDAYRNLVIRP